MVLIVNQEEIAIHLTKHTLYFQYSINASSSLKPLQLCGNVLWHSTTAAGTKFGSVRHIRSADVVVSFELQAEAIEFKSGEPSEPTKDAMETEDSHD
jgi:hypothetical protein